MTQPARLEILPVTGVGEVEAHADLTSLLMVACTELRDELRDGDIVLVTSKVVSKAEGMSRRQDRLQTVSEETVDVLAVRGETRIVRTRHGFVLAAAGVDASNTAPGTVLLLPRDSDASARRIREGVAERAGVNVAVVVTDTAGRAWRNGQTDHAIGVAGLLPLEDHAGRTDTHGNTLAVTEPAIADELAAAADLVKGKLGAIPFAVARGLAPRVLPTGEHGPGVADLLRDPATDMFGLGAREAVLAALAGSAERFGAPAPLADLAAALAAVTGLTPTVQDDGAVLPVVPERQETAVVAVLAAHGWVAIPDEGSTWRLAPSGA